MNKSNGRAAQKSRTRKAIIDGARQLLAEGRPVTVQAAAALQDISKATAYRYFSSAALLTAEAGLDVEVKSYEEVVAGAKDVRAALRAINRYFFDLAAEHEARFRQFIAMTLEIAPGEAKSLAMRRGGRRIQMYERALAAFPHDLSEKEQRRLICALSATTGSEAMISLYDVAGAGREEARDVVSFICDAITGEAFSQRRPA